MWTYLDTVLNVSKNCHVLNPKPHPVIFADVIYGWSLSKNLIRKIVIFLAFWIQFKNQPSLIHAFMTLRATLEDIREFVHLMLDCEFSKMNIVLTSKSCFGLTISEWKFKIVHCVFWAVHKPRGLFLALFVTLLTYLWLIFFEILGGTPPKCRRLCLKNRKCTKGLKGNVKKIGILLPKLFWTTVRKNCSSDQKKLLKFEAEGQEFSNILRSLEQFIQTLKGQNNFW